LSGFEHPSYLYLLAGIPILLFLYAGFRIWRAKALSALGDEDLLALWTNPIRSEGMQVGAWALGLLLVILAWANPRGGTATQTSEQSNPDVAILLDVSSSMLTMDVAPNRLEMAKLFASLLLSELSDARIALVFFAGEAALQMPLTTDKSAILSLLQYADPSSVSTQGTQIAQALSLAQRCLHAPSDGVYTKAIVLITDGEDHSGRAKEMAEKNLQEGTILYVVGVGTPEGGKVPLGPDTFKEHTDGTPVVSRLDVQFLQLLADSGGGQLHDLSAAKSVASSIRQLKNQKMNVVSFRETRSFYQWLLLPGWILLMFSLFWTAFTKQPEKI
jgi:Ca-activated chloride channel family protein